MGARFRRASDRLSSEGKTLHVDLYEAGQGRPVVIFLPGMGCHVGLYGEFLSDLAADGFNVVALDPPGHGRSSGARGDFTFDAVMTAVCDATSYATARFGGDVGLVGTSLGGTYALYAATREPRLKAVLCHNCMDIAHDLHVATRFPRAFRFALRRLRPLAALAPWLPTPLRLLVNWRRVVDSATILDAMRADTLMVWRYSLRSWLSFLDAGSVDLSTILVPAKVIVGSRDLLFPPAYCRAMAARIGPHGAAFEMLEGGHGLTLEQAGATAHIARLWFAAHLRPA